MASDLRALVRVRDLRAQLAQNEASRLLQVTAGAQAAVDEARRRQQLHVEQAAQASALATGQARGGGEARFLATEAHGLMDFAAGERFRAREAVALIRRAELVRERAKEASDAAGEEYRRLAMRRETVARQSDRRRRSALQRKLEREDETIVEEQATSAAVLRANQAKDQADDGRANR